MHIIAIQRFSQNLIRSPTSLSQWKNMKHIMSPFQAWE